MPVMSHADDFLMWQLYPEKKSGFPNASQDPLGQIMLSQMQVGTLAQRASRGTPSLQGVQ